MRETRFTWPSISPFQSTNDNRSVEAQSYRILKHDPWYGLFFSWMAKCEAWRAANSNIAPPAPTLPAAAPDPKVQRLYGAWMDYPIEKMADAEARLRSRKGYAALFGSDPKTDQ